MRIAYGVSGEGLGHVFEAIEIGSHLQKHGHTLKVLTYGPRALDGLRAFDPVRIEGFPLFFNRRGKLSAAKTFWKTLPTWRFFLTQGNRIRRELEAFDPDVVLTAYEPFTTLLAHLIGKPLVSMDNQCALLYLDRAPKGYWLPFHMARAATRVVTFGAQAYIVKAYHPPTGAVPKHVRFVTPVIQRDIRRLRPTVGAHVLVYLTKPNPALVRILRGIDERFIVYCCDEVGEEGNVIRRAHGPRFLEDLASCKAIIGTSGFSLIADAMFLRKPYFGVPLKGQFEQTLNARFLADSGLGEYTENPTRETLVAFLRRLEPYRERLVRRDFNPAEQEETVNAVLEEVAAAAAGRITSASLALSPE